MRTLTFDEVRQAAHDVVIEAGPDFEYRQKNGYCSYTEPDYSTPHDVGNPDRKCSCAVGRILFRCGVSLDVLAELDDNGAGPLNCVLIHHSHLLPVKLEDKAASFLFRFQELQDHGMAWGACMTDAVSYAQDPTYFTRRHDFEGCDNE